MVDLAQLVRVPDCGSVGRGFESHIPPFASGLPVGSPDFYPSTKNGQQAGVAELVDAPDLGSGSEKSKGSSPFIRTDVTEQ